MVRLAQFVLIIEYTAAQHRNAQRVEISRIGFASERIQLQTRALRRMLGNRKYGVAFLSRPWCPGDKPGSLHARQAAHSRQRRFMKCQNLFRRIVFLGWQSVSDRQHIVSHAAKIGCSEMNKASEKQSRR